MVVKKWFTLLTVTGLTGFVASVNVAACSSDTAPSPAATTDSGTDTGTKKPNTNPTPGDDEEPASQCPLPTFKYSEKEIEGITKTPWVPPVQTKGACTDDEITTFDKNLGDATDTTKIDDMAKGLSAGCKSCIFSTSSDKNWQLVVAIAGNDPTAGFINFGACHAVEESSPACGKDYQYNQFCVNTACEKCASDAEESKCLDTVWAKDGQCDVINTAVEASCKLLAESTCGSSTKEHAAALCGGGTAIKDAGLDVDAQ